jgi:PAS domain S-box-containing protein
MGAGNKAEAGRFEVLAAIGEVADGTLSFPTTVERLLEIVVPEFADLAILDALGGDGGLRRIGARIDDPNRAELEAAVMRRKILVDSPVGTARAIATSESNLLTSVTAEDLRLIANSDEDLELLLSLQLSSALFIPLRARGRILGAFACGVGRSGRRYTPDDLRFAEVLSGRISLALDNAGLSRTVGELEQQLESAFVSLAEAVLVRDGMGRLIFANPAVVELLGFESADDMKSTRSEDLMGRYEAFDESGRGLSLADLPSARALAGETPGPMLVRNVVRSTGVERWLLHKATPVFDEEGQVTLVVNVIEDVSEVKRAEISQRLLAEASKELSSSLDYEQTLQRVAHLAVPHLADWCGVRICGPHDELEQVAVAHVDPKKVELVREYGERTRTRVSDSNQTGDVIRSGKPLLIREITPELIDQAGIPEPRAALIRDLQMRSVIIVPLMAPGRPALGVMTLVMAESGRLFEERDLAMAEELGRRAAMAVENARLYTERSHIATTLQQSLLPAELPKIAGFELASLYRAAGGPNDVGGDFYDAFEIPSGWMIVVGDVTGRGPQAAALTSLARYTLRTAGRLLDDPLAALAELNSALREVPQPSLVTIACALLQETSEGTQASLMLAGHPPPYHLRAGTARQVGSFASPLGAYEAGGWRPETVKLEPGDELVLYTDGVTDTVGHGERFGEERLGKVLAGAVSAAETIGRIDRALKEFALGPQSDDTAVLVLERQAAPASGGGGEALLVRGVSSAA